jgi:hypothetical protein
MVPHLSVSKLEKKRGRQEKRRNFVARRGGPPSWSVERSIVEAKALCQELEPKTMGLRLGEQSVKEDLDRMRLLLLALGAAIVIVTCLFMGCIGQYYIIKITH